MNKGTTSPGMVNDLDVRGKLQLHKTVLSEDQVSDCLDIADWPVLSGTGSRALDATTGPINDTSIKLTPGAASETTVRKSVSLNIERRYIKFAVKLEDAANTTDTRVHIWDSSGNHRSAQLTSTNDLEYFLKDFANWKYVAIHPFEFTDGDASIDYSSIVYVGVSINPGVGTPSIWFGDVRVRDLPWPGKVVFTFDGVFETHFLTAAPDMLSYGWRGDFYLNASLLGGSEMSWAQAQALHRMGMNIGDHGWDHTAMDTLGAAALRKAFVLSQNEFRSYGIHRGTDMLVFPYNKYSDTVLAEAKNHYRVICAGQQKLDCMDPDTPGTYRYEVGSVTGAKIMNQAQLQAALAAVKRHGGVFRSLTHQIDPVGGNSGPTAAFWATHLSEVAASGLEVVTDAELFQRAENTPQAIATPLSRDLALTYATNNKYLSTAGFSGLVYVDSTTVSNLYLPAASSGATADVINVGPNPFTFTRIGSDTIGPFGATTVTVLPFTRLRLVGDQSATWRVFGAHGSVLAPSLLSERLVQVPASGWTGALIGAGNGAVASGVLHHTINSGTVASTGYIVYFGTVGFGGNISNFSWASRLVWAFDIVRNVSDAECVYAVQLGNFAAPATAGALADKGIGIAVSNLTISGVSYGTQLGSVAMGSLTNNVRARIMIVLSPGVRIEFYRNGYLVGTQSTAAAIPTTTSNTPYVRHYITNGPSAVDDYAMLSKMGIWQE